MIDKLKQLLSSEDSLIVKQGIELILSLDMAEELYEAFHDMIHDSDFRSLKVGHLFTGFLHFRTKHLHKVVLLSLISAIPSQAKLIKHLIITAKDDFIDQAESLGINLACLKHVTQLELHGVKSKRISTYFEYFPNLKTLTLKGMEVKETNRFENISHLELDSLKKTSIDILLKSNDHIQSLVMKNCNSVGKHKLPKLSFATFECVKALTLNTFLELNPQIEVLTMEKVEVMIAKINIPQLRSASFTEMSSTAIRPFLLENSQIELLKLQRIKGDLVIKFDQLKSLISQGAAWQTVQSLLIDNPHIKRLSIDSRYRILWTHASEALKNSAVESLSIKNLNLDDLFNSPEYNDLHPILEKGCQGPIIYSEETIHELLNSLEIDLGSNKAAWLPILRRTIITKSHKINDISFTMIYCPPGEFWMGSNIPIHHERIERCPRHKVKLTKGFWISETHYPHRLGWLESVELCNTFSRVENLNPAYTVKDEQVEWHKDANGYRLPFEHEWEYAAKAGTEFIFAGSNTLDDVGWYGKGIVETKHGYKTTRGNVKSMYVTPPLAQKKPNAWGLYDMSGRLAEWCNEVWQERTAITGEEITVDPYFYQSSDSGQDRVIRGGASSDSFEVCQVAFRQKCYISIYSSPNTTLRLVKGIANARDKKQSLIKWNRLREQVNHLTKKYDLGFLVHLKMLMFSLIPCSTKLTNTLLTLCQFDLDSDSELEELVVREQFEALGVDEKYLISLIEYLIDHCSELFDQMINLARFQVSEQVLESFVNHAIIKNPSLSKTRNDLRVLQDKLEAFNHQKKRILKQKELDEYDTNKLKMNLDSLLKVSSLRAPNIDEYLMTDLIIKENYLQYYILNAKYEEAQETLLEIKKLSTHNKYAVYYAQEIINLLGNN